MRHGKKDNHLGRKVGHRRALLSNMASSLILYKRIETTVAKAKALRRYVEPLLTKSKSDTTHSRRTVFAHLQNKESVKVLFGDIAERIANRPGGYTRIIKLGNRLGDNADLCFIELVDYNEAMLRSETEGKTKTRRSRRGSKSKASDAQEMTGATLVTDETDDAAPAPSAEIADEPAKDEEGEKP